MNYRTFNSQYPFINHLVWLLILHYLFTDCYRHNGTRKAKKCGKSRRPTFGDPLHSLLDFCHSYEQSYHQLRVVPAGVQNLNFPFDTAPDYTAWRWIGNFFGADEPECSKLLTKWYQRTTSRANIENGSRMLPMDVLVAQTPISLVHSLRSCRIISCMIWKSEEWGITRYEIIKSDFVARVHVGTPTTPTISKH